MVNWVAGLLGREVEMLIVTAPATVIVHSEIKQNINKINPTSHSHQIAKLCKVKTL